MKSAKQKAIGIFDSGIGGTTIWKEIKQLLPNENTIYLSDNKNAPYGQKSKEEIVRLSKKNTEYLLDNNCKIIVVACNTATTNAIKVLRQCYNVPFVGIEPAIKPAAIKTKTNIIGILATKGTLNSKLFETTSSNLESKPMIIEQIGEGLVDLIEKGKIHSKEMKLLLKKYLTPMINANADCIVLGCTHYPYLKKLIKNIVGDTIRIIDSGQAVATQTKKLLENHQLINSNEKECTTTHQFLFNGKSSILEDILTEYRNSITVEQKEF